MKRIIGSVDVNNTPNQSRIFFAAEFDLEKKNNDLLYTLISLPRDSL